VTIRSPLPPVTLLLLLLSGCSALPPTTSQAAREQAWQRHQQTLASLEQWQLVGRIALIDESQAWHARIDWQQQQQRYTLRLTGPLSQGSLELRGTPQQVVLRDADGERVATDPAQLLAAEVGWQVPVAALRYWVLGLPDPTQPAQRQLNDSGHLTQLQQARWQIRFSDYQPYAQYTLPTQLHASSADGSVKLIISQWQPGAMPPPASPITPRFRWPTPPSSATTPQSNGSR